MHRASPSQPDSPLSSEPLDIAILAEVLVERELPLVDIDLDLIDLDLIDHTDSDHTDSELTVVDLTEIDLTVVDLTKPDLTGPSGDGAKTHTRSPGWGLSDGTATGRLVTPDHVLAARTGYRSDAEGRQLIRSIGIFHQTPAGFANDYAIRHLLGTAAPSPRGAVSPVDGSALARATLLKDAQHRLEHFLNLPDDDFSACFRFNGEITREYLTQVERCERDREAARHEAAEPVPEPSPKQRRQRKSRSLRQR